MAKQTDETGALRASDSSPDTGTNTEDATIVRETRSIGATEPGQSTEVFRDSGAQIAQRRSALHKQYGGMYWGSAFIGFAVAVFFLILLLGIVGAIVGAVGFQLNTPVPKIGDQLTQTTQNLGIGALAGSVIAVFVAYLIGGYTAGRMARFDGARNGAGVWLWTIVAAIVLGAIGGILGKSFNVASQIHLNIDAGTLTAASVVSVAVTLLVMLAAAVIGGTIGERYHRRIDRDMEAMR